MDTVNLSNIEICERVAEIEGREKAMVAGWFDYMGNYPRIPHNGKLIFSRK